MNKKVLIGFLAGTAVGAFGGILFAKKKGKGWKKKKKSSDDAPEMADSGKNKDRAQSTRGTAKDDVRSAVS